MTDSPLTAFFLRPTLAIQRQTPQTIVYGPWLTRRCGSSPGVRGSFEEWDDLPFDRDQNAPRRPVRVSALPLPNPAHTLYESGAPFGLGRAAGCRTAGLRGALPRGRLVRKVVLAPPYSHWTEFDVASIPGMRPRSQLAADLRAFSDRCSDGSAGPAVATPCRLWLAQ